MDQHLDESKRSSGNKRNVIKTTKVKSSLGSFELETPQERNSSFQPKIVKKRQTILANQLSDKIIGLYGLGMSYKYISSNLKEMYDADISHIVLSQITDQPDIKQWQNCPLESMYCIVWLYAVHYKVKIDGCMESKALYNIIEVNKEEQKKVLGMYISESEGANFWLSVLKDLHNRGLEDILIACTDNVKGFSEAILSLSPKTQIQKCVLHQIRNSMKYVASKDKKVYERLKRSLQSTNKSFSRTIFRGFKRKMAGKISNCDRELAKQLGGTQYLF